MEKTLIQLQKDWEKLILQEFLKDLINYKV